jgi:hypothetical protein
MLLLRAAIFARAQRFGTADGWEGPNELLLTAGQRPAI